MDLRTFTGLKAAVADYLGREDLADRIPTFIALAEQRMNRELRLRVMERRAETAVQAAQSSVPLPWRREAGNWDVFLEMRDLVFTPAGGESRNLRYAPPDLYAVTRAAGMPREYTIIGRDLFLLPTPDAAGTLRLTYYAEIEPLGTAQPENSVLLMFPDLYLYGALVESGPFTRGSAPVDMWAQYYTTARAKAQSNEQRARFTSNLSMKGMRRI